MNEREKIMARKKKTRRVSDIMPARKVDKKSNCQRENLVRN